MTKALRFFTFWLALASSILASWQMAQAAPALTLSPTSGPPTKQATASGTGFGANEAIDVYFDTTDLVLGVSNGTGAFSSTLKVPSAAPPPGTHWITAVGRKSGSSAQKSFVVQTNWTQFRYGPKHQGYSPYEKLLSTSTVAGLNQAWRYDTGDSVIASSPAVANGAVYFGCYDGKLYALNASTGAVKSGFPYTTGDSIHQSSPAVAGGAVYFGCYDGKLYALNASTGAVRWDYTTGGLIQSCPAVAGGVVYVGSNDGKLYALNASTGAVKWTATTGGDIFTSPAVANGVVYAGSMDGSLYAYSLTPDAVFGILTARPDPARLVPDLSLKPQPR